MLDALDFLSGNVPGGFILYLFLLFVVGFILFFLGRYSEIFAWEKMKTRLVYYGISLTTIYAAAWLALRPAQLPDKIVVFPSLGQTYSEKLAFADLAKTMLAEAESGYYVYQPEWFVESFGEEWTSSQEKQLMFAAKIDAEYAIIARTEGNQYSWAVVDADNFDQKPEMTHQATRDNLVKELQSSLSAIRGVRLKQFSAEAPFLSEGIYRLKWWYMRDSLDQILALYPTLQESEQNSNYVKTAYAAALLRKGYEVKKRNEDIKNPYKFSENHEDYFNKARKPLVETALIEPENTDIGLLIAHANILEEKFDIADAALKNVVVNDRYNARAYFLLSFLHPSRYPAYGFNDRRELLDHALALDPAYEAALLRYMEKIGSENVTAKRALYDLSIDRCMAYLDIKPFDAIVWSELAGLYLLGKNYQQAEITIQKALSLDNQNPDIVYNAGIIFYRLTDYPSALEYFNRLIAMNNTLDAYLYRAMIHRHLGDTLAAITDFRYRIRNKTGDGDRYYKEALKGLNRLINELDERGVDVNALETAGQ
jgi:tetratricopeptide (TPR) repeat protein